jgi:hypothetical protein
VDAKSLRLQAWEGGIFHFASQPFLDDLFKCYS